VLVRERFRVKSPGQVSGLSVALPGDTTRAGGPVWYGGGKLAADLSWPKLRQRWTPTRAAPGRPHRNLTAEERNAVWDHAARAAADAAAQIRNLAWTDPAAGADAAWAASGTRHVAASLSVIGATDRSPVRQANADSSRAMQAVAGSPGCPGTGTGSRGRG
jgi:hypothetical protein